MKSGQRIFALVISTAALAFAMMAPSALAAGKVQTLTGQVSDSMCGASHMMKGSAADCTRACVTKGSKYALVVGETVYTLESNDKSVTDQLNNLAGGQASVTGTVNANSIAVKSVMGAGK